MSMIKKMIIGEHPVKNSIMYGEVIKESALAVKIDFHVVKTYSHLLGKNQSRFEWSCWIPKSVLVKETTHNKAEVYKIKQWFLAKGLKAKKIYPLKETI